MKGTFGTPTLVGKVPPRIDIPVSKEGTVGFYVYEVTGTDVYRPHEGAKWPPESLDDCRVIGIDSNLITTKDGLREGRSCSSKT